MKLYEKEAKKILKEKGLKTPNEGEGFVIKAQVLANHRKEKRRNKVRGNKERGRETG